MALAEGVHGKQVLEVGARNVNGSVRPIIETGNPSEYIGIDIEAGEGVDRVQDITEEIGFAHQFDIVIACELIEHVDNWTTAIQNMKVLTREGGLILVTTRAPGFPRHEHPSDYWRFTPELLAAAFRDCEIVDIDGDKLTPGVFIAARRTENLQPYYPEAIPAPVA